MNRFSVSLLRKEIKLYRATKENYKDIIEKYPILDNDLLCKTFFEDEITLYVHYTIDNQALHELLLIYCVCDSRLYRIMDIHEDVPGIDHVGIIFQISRLFMKQNIPILYVNTFEHNIVFFALEYMDKVMSIIEGIAYL